MKPEDCKDIDTLRNGAQERKLDCCQECKRKSDEEFPVFAAGCSTHQTSISPKILFIFRDPHYQTCKDEQVCGWCHNDSSAKNFVEKIYLILEMQESNEHHPIYCINSVLCGPEEGNSKPSVEVFKTCSNVLKAYVRLLKPKLVVACGNDARDRLADAFGIKRKEFKKAEKPVEKSGNHFFWSYHPAP